MNGWAGRNALAHNRVSFGVVWPFGSRPRYVSGNWQDLAV